MKLRYFFCSQQPLVPLDAYGSYLQEHGLLGAQCNNYGDFGFGSSCRATQVCDSTSSRECGFRCGVNALDREHSVDRWVGRSARELLRNATEPWFLQVGLEGTSKWPEVNFLGPHPPLVAEDFPNEPIKPAVDPAFEDASWAAKACQSLSIGS